MGTRGAITFVTEGDEKTVYNRFDSYPTGLGATVLDWLRSPGWDLAIVRSQVKALRLVDESDEPTAEERERYAHRSDSHVSTGTDWYSLLRTTQGNPAAILEAGAACDASRFPYDSLFCEWAYVVDLDQEVFEVYRGFQRGAPTEGRWVGKLENSSDGYWRVDRVHSKPISEIRQSDIPSSVLMDALERGDTDNEDN